MLNENSNDKQLKKIEFAEPKYTTRADEMNITFEFPYTITDGEMKGSAYSIKISMNDSDKNRINSQEIPYLFFAKAKEYIRENIISGNLHPPKTIVIQDFSYNSQQAISEYLKPFFI